MKRLKDFSPGGRGYLTKEEIVEIAHKHRVSEQRVNLIAQSVMRIDNDPSYERECDLRPFVGDYKKLGRFFDAAHVWFVCKARKDGMSLYDAVDLLVALTIGQK